MVIILSQQRLVDKLLRTGSHMSPTLILFFYLPLSACYLRLVMKMLYT